MTSLENAIARLRRGDLLRMELLDAGATRFWFEGPVEEVSEAVARRIRAAGALVEVGDSLFGLSGNSQTWLSAENSDADPA